MKQVFINAISYHLPSDILSNEKISRDFPEWNVEKISSKTGISERHICKNEEFASDLAIKAAEKLLNEHNIDKSTIDFLLYCTQSPDYFLPTTACILQDKLNLKTNIGALDLKNSGGRVLFKQQKRQAALGQKNMEKFMAEYLQSQEKATELINFLQEKREIVIKESIRYEKQTPM